MKNELEFAKKLAHDAGEIMRKNFDQTDISHYKSDDTIVTKADTEINQMVIDRVRAEYPDHGVYGEEKSFDRDRKNLWVCDPIDGTKMFTLGFPLSVFSLALVINGKPQLGVIYDPWIDKIYTAVKGQGAYCNNVPIKVNSSTLGDHATVINYSISRNSPYDIYGMLTGLSRNGNNISIIGSVAHGGVAVANGAFVADIFTGTTNHNVDVAAVKVIIEEAGGKVTDLFGEDQRYDGDIKGAIASNGIVHDELVQIFKDNLEEEIK